MGIRAMSIAALTVTLAVIGMTNALSNTRGPQSVETRTIEPLTWVLDRPRPTSPTVSRDSNPEHIVPAEPETPVATRDADSSGGAANAGRGDPEKHPERDEPTRETRIDSWSPGPQVNPGALLYINGRNLSQIEVYLDGIPLEVEARREWAPDLQLPDYAVTGPLGYYDPATSEYRVLADSFAVKDV
ncbi:MAG: hypothetical protein LJE91_15025 [Gammaproteobacteria bacterium]|nr:hypothetical protein [Gammaproteobacteria bacterium]